MNRFPAQPIPAARIAPRIALSLLVAAAVGPLFNNLALARFSTFPITIPMLLLAAAAGIAFFTPRRPASDDTTLFLWMLLIGWQFFVGLVLGLTTESEWVNPFMLFCFYTTTFMVASRLPIDRSDIAWAIYTLASLIIIFGGLGVVQFILLNQFRIVPALPAEISAVPWNPAIDIYRTDGVLRPAGLSYEPATYSISLSFALVLMMLLTSLFRFQNRKLLLVSGLFLLSGSLLALSLSGWAVAIPALLISALNAKFRRITIPVIIVVMAVVIVVFYAGFASVVTGRLNDIAAGQDESANVRVLAALALLVHPVHDLAHFFTGNGLGQNSAFAALMDEVYLQKFGIAETNIHNIFTIVRVTQGWAGIVLHMLLLLAVMRPDFQQNRAFYVPMFVTIIALHFSSGFYLDPAFWAILALIAVLRSIDADQPAGAPALRWGIWSSLPSDRLPATERR